jgi:hypothetical protein
VKVDPEIVAALCRKHAPDLLTPVSWQGTPLDKVRLLWGIAGVESSFGLNCNPRHEQGYCYGARYFNPHHTSEWGCLAHCSFGPWQVMFSNFPEGVSPLALVWLMDGRVASEACLLGAIRTLNRAIAAGTRNLGDVVIAYNGPADEGHYAARLSECMDRPMPEGVTPVNA